MKRFTNKYILLFLCGIVGLLSSCKSSKTVIVSDGSAVSKTQEQLFEDILESEVNFRTISGKVSLEMLTGNQTSGMKVNSQLKIIKDDIIQISLRMPFINTEIFRMNITPDSVYAIDRVNKRIAVENIARLEKEKGVIFNYSNMQSLFTNALFYPGKNKVTPRDADKYNVKLESGKYYLHTRDKSGINYSFVVNVDDHITETTIAGAKNDYTLNWIYDQFIKDGNNIYPTKMTAEVRFLKKRLGLVMSYSGLDINKDTKVDRSLPSNYKRVSVGDILKAYLK